MNSNKNPVHQLGVVKLLTFPSPLYTNVFESNVFTSSPLIGAFLVAQWYRTCLPMQEMQALSLGREDLLEKERATHSSILAWEIPWTEESGGLQSMGSQRSRTRLRD